MTPENKPMRGTDINKIFKALNSRLHRLSDDQRVYWQLEIVLGKSRRKI